MLLLYLFWSSKKKGFLGVSQILCQHCVAGLLSRKVLFVLDHRFYGTFSMTCMAKNPQKTRATFQMPFELTTFDKHLMHTCCVFCLGYGLRLLTDRVVSGLLVDGHGCLDLSRRACLRSSREFRKRKLGKKNQMNSKLWRFERAPSLQ